jgi:ABC-type sulfate transport system substrate-binding protein
VRQGNPNGLEASVITPHPKTPGHARWSYREAWRYALGQSANDEAKAREFVARLYKNAPRLDAAARRATVTLRHSASSPSLTSPMTGLIEASHPRVNASKTRGES